MVVLLAITVSVHAQNPVLNTYHPNILVLKLKSESNPGSRVTSSQDDQLEKIKSLANADKTEQVFPQKSLSNTRSIASGLQNIYKIKLTPGTNLWQTISRIQQSGLVEYVEPLYQNEVLYIPNDPEADPSKGKQDYLAVIKAHEAWDIEKSDTSMIIGIVDTGVNMNHEDLQNIAYNHNDPINGVDDDADGYIDNYYGWDVADEDNDPTADGHPHGTPVTGMSSAATNNGIGMAGVGFNARYLPVKIAETSSQKLTKDYEGVKYAADHGAKVINLSWGAAGNYSQYGQDIINYAVLEKDAVVVAAAGNTNEELDFYPASYENVLSVGATDINDNKASWATYSYYIDIMAPGDNVYTTKNNGSYEITTGSSFASPLVAGAAALVRSRFPELNAIQVMEQLRVTSDNIYPVGENMTYEGKLGKGRLNIQRALSDILTPSVRLSDFQYKSNHGQLVFAGDTVEVELEFTNYLRTAENLSVSFTCVTENVALESDNIYISSLETFQSFTNSDQPFVFIVNEDVSPEDRLFFRIDFLGNYYNDFQYFEIPLTPNHFDISDGNIAATITSDGDIGYDDEDYKDGNGIAIDNEIIATNAGLIISQDKDHVMNNVINDFDAFTRDKDFAFEKSIRLYDNSVADYDGRSIFKPFDTLTSALPLRIEQKVLTWDNLTQNGFLVFEYRIINIGDSAITGLNTGIFADWDLGNYETNGVATDESLKLGYTYDKSSNNQYSGLALLSNQTFSHRAIDLFSLNGNAADFDTIFSDSIKHSFISSATQKYVAGTQGSGNNVAQLLGAKNFDLLPNEATKITIAMLASSSLDGLKEALILANEKYALYRDHPPIEQTFFACLGDSATLDPSGENYEFYQDLNLTQRLDSGSIYKTPPIEKDTFYYAINLDSTYFSDIMRFNVRPGNPTANFILAPDTLLIESGEAGSVLIENTSILGSIWAWDFGNGYQSSVENPTTNYDSPGAYPIELIASNEYGCSDTLMQELLVAIRSDRPVLEDQNICKHTSTIISATNTNQIRIYSNEQKTQQIFEGAEFETGIIKSDTTFFITNFSGTYESIAIPLNISIKAPEMGFKYAIDTMDLTNQYSLIIQNSEGLSDSLYWNINDVFASRDSVFYHQYSAEPFEISQVKIDQTGCSDSLSIEIEPAYSILPANYEMEVCKNSSFVFKPKSGEIFYFYSDEEKTELIHKGASLSIRGLEENSHFYFSNVDKLLESTTASFVANVNPVNAKISIASDSILLEDAINVEIANSSEHATESFWLYPAGTFDTTSVLIESFDDIGVYDYQLVALSKNGCSDTTNQRISVYTITGLEDLNISEITIYPNPTSSMVTIELGEHSDETMGFNLINMSGKSVQDFYIPKGQTSYQLNMQHLQEGIYYIQPMHSFKLPGYKVVKY